jgi:purine-binding chemotaxis protein CheW
VAVREAPSAPADALVQYLTFRLGAEEYGLEILKVQEIRAVSPITPVPNAPPYVKGVMNLRGTIIPVLDLRTRLGMVETAHGRFTVIIVVLMGARSVGLVVDGVCDVLAIAKTEIEAAAGLVSSQDVTFVAGLARAGERLVVLLDLEAILKSEATPAAPRAD